MSLLAVSVASLAGAVRSPCDPVHLPTRGPGPSGAVCRCTVLHCDTVDPLALSAGDQEVVFYQTSLGNDTDRLTRKSTTFVSSSGGDWQTIVLDPNQTYQSIIGFGGALTDAAAINFDALSTELQDHVINSYYSADGIEYSLGRIPMAACDFSTHVYSYDDVAEEDLNLTHFSVKMDETFKIPLIHRVTNATQQRENGSAGIRFFGSPWQTPMWMTDKNSSLNAKLKGQAGDAIHKSWALYFSKFISAYKAYGVDIWGMTVDNEPAGNTGKWQDVKLSPEEERDFIKLDLGPQLRRDHPDVKIMMLDDQRTHLSKWTDTILGDANAAKFVDGIGVHWYASVEDTIPPFGHLSDAHRKYPAAFILGTEACEGFLPWSQGVYPGDWNRAQTYAHDIIGDLNNFASGWTDWNILLDLVQSGGPNWAGNVVDAPLIANATSGDVFYKQPMYYYMGHISKFIPPGSVRIGVDSKGIPVVGTAMEATAFATPAGRIVVVVLNRDVASHEFAIQHPTKGYVQGQIPAHAIQTYVFNQHA